METQKSKKGVNWKLPLDLIRAVKRHAADKDVYPSDVAVIALSEYLSRQDARKRPAAAAGAR